MTDPEPEKSQVQEPEKIYPPLNAFALSSVVADYSSSEDERPSTKIQELVTPVEMPSKLSAHSDAARTAPVPIFEPVQVKPISTGEDRQRKRKRREDEAPSVACVAEDSDEEVIDLNQLLKKRMKRPKKTLLERVRWQFLLFYCSCVFTPCNSWLYARLIFLVL